MATLSFFYRARANPNKQVENDSGGHNYFAIDTAVISD